MREFHLSLYFEHLEEASFLYEQRQALLRDPVFPWTQLQKFEARLEAHLDALVIGGALAQEACAVRMREGDAGELFASLSVFCRQRQIGMLGELLRTLDFKSAAKVRAATDALKFEMPQDWNDSCERALARSESQWFMLLAEVCGYRRLPVGELLAAALQSQQQPASLPVIEALARLQPSRQSTSALEMCTQETADEIKAAAILALLRQGRRNALRPCYLRAQNEDWPQLVLALGGERSAVAALLQRLDSHAATGVTLLALGLLGDLTTVRLLCRCLEDESLAASAATALQLITGAALYEDKFVPDEVDPAEMFESELEAWRQNGQSPQRADGRPFGAVVRQLSRSVSVWEEWLARNAARFAPGLRYRLGQPYSPHALLHSMLDESTSNELRKLANDELVIRYGCPVAFESDWLVTDQLQALRNISEWVAANAAHFTPGAWS